MLDSLEILIKCTLAPELKAMGDTSSTITSTTVTEARSFRDH